MMIRTFTFSRWSAIDRICRLQAQRRPANGFVPLLCSMSQPLRVTDGCTETGEPKAIDRDRREPVGLSGMLGRMRSPALGLGHSATGEGAGPIFIGSSVPGHRGPRREML